MTDKQIIIDEIDVSGCTRYCADNGKCTAFKSQYLCSERNNCYTKRILKKNKTINILKEKLLRKEQECERLRFPMQDTNYAILAKEEFEEYKKLKAENDELKKEINNKYSVSNFNVIFMREHIHNLKQTLAEIKEIAEHCIEQDICTICDNSDKCHIEDEEVPTYDVCKLILQKISECEGK